MKIPKYIIQEEVSIVRQALLKEGYSLEEVNETFWKLRNQLKALGSNETLKQLIKLQENFINEMTNNQEELDEMGEPGFSSLYQNP